VKASALGLLALASCGGSSGATSAPADGGASLDGSFDGASTSDGPASGGDASASAQIGIIVLASWDYVLGTTPTVGSGVSVGFLAYDAGISASPACPATTDGPCTIKDCPTPGADAGQPTPRTASAGAVQVTGAAMPVLLVPSGASYPPLQSSARLWSGGESLDVLAMGAEVPAFSAALTAPSYVTVTAPAWPALGSTLAIDRSQPLAFAWSGGHDGTVQVEILGDMGPQRTSITCLFPAASGSGTVPATALARFPLVTTGASLSVDCITDKSVTAGGWSILVRASTQARTAAGDGVVNVAIP
jgi:hypothetical protein